MAKSASGVSALAGVVACPTIVNAKIAALDPAELGKCVPKARHPALIDWVALGNVRQHTNPPDVLCLLRARREGPCPLRDRAA